MLPFPEEAFGFSSNQWALGMFVSDFATSILLLIPMARRAASPDIDEVRARKLYRFVTTAEIRHMTISAVRLISHPDRSML
jgi:hypothetical protein